MPLRPRVRLVAATVPLLDALVNDPDGFAGLIGSPVPDGWPEFPEAIAVTVEYLNTASAAERPWSMQFFIDDATGALIGSGGYTGPPSDRTVEIGYEVAPAFRGRGFGAAAARALVERAFDGDEVDHVIAHTLPGPNGSTGVLESLGFRRVGERDDPDAGVVWGWALAREAGRPVPAADAGPARPLD